MPIHESMRVACVQFCAGMSVARNLEVISQGIIDAASKGANFVQLPEMANLMQIDKTKAADELAQFGASVFLEALQELSLHYGLWLHVGSLIVPKKKFFRNRGYILNAKGEVAEQYDKIHLFDVDLAHGESYRESANFRAGKQAVVVETPWGKLGMGICFDLRFAGFYQAMAQAGATILSAPAAFTKTTGQAHWHSLVRARAIENGALMIACNQGGLHEDGRETYGHSLIVDAWGKVVAEGAAEGTNTVIGDLNPSQPAEVRGMIPTLDLVRKFTVKVPA